MNEVDLAILRACLVKKELKIFELRAAFRNYGIDRTISYNYVYQRLCYLKGAGLLEYTNLKPLVFRIQRERYEEISRFILAWVMLEEALCSKK